ncbi:hypothetical protein [Natranaeroarchaeum aerophilus]|uniref:hypothetical protein n=1 Tax=Natranaeroarchaeum aerophilus TaxID=2917711 RepID=UPI002029B5F5|nr:hypothetical protein [Natranaeroarchaeum aerophilus]
MDDIEKECASAAADAAIDHLDDSLDVDLSDPDSYWISSVLRQTADGYRIEIHIIAANSGGDDGSYLYCPPEQFEFESAIEALPSRVNVTLNVNDEENGYECSHEVWAIQEERHYD